MNYYGKNKVISRYRLGTAIDELNELLNKSKKLLEDAREGKISVSSGQIVDLFWYIKEAQEEYDLQQKEEV